MTLDLASGYWQIAMDVASRVFTAFSTPDGHYQFKRLPFGLKNAPTNLNRIMQTVVVSNLNVEIYFDDIIVHSKNFEEHVKNLEHVFEQIKTANLKI